MARKLAGLLSVSQLAKMMGVSRRTALRRLRALDRRAKGGVLLRFSEGATVAWYTTLSRLRAAEPKLLEDHEILRSDVDRLKEENLQNRAEITRLRHRVRTLESAAKAGQPASE